MSQTERSIKPSEGLHIPYILVFLFLLDPSNVIFCIEALSRELSVLVCVCVGGGLKVHLGDELKIMMSEEGLLQLVD